MEHLDYSFEKDYDFSVEVPSNDEDDTYTETIEGSINFSADVVWTGTNYETYIIWKDSTGRFDDVNGDAPDKEEDFYQDLKDYLLSQGVNSSDLDW
ncbi:hypothetical protein [Lactococcus allomyrinae]|uniref:Uncharacterized protein n=1 Tax=Lactococcus allomyrinae TaxID=2419773 RepID=A0A387BGQ9_9LACT|nr:hypothetical protein [Lactococcus allomyrinae]AYG01342.1 hypothetical protein D7I46_09695 [Lactococcus allomyrinae]